MRKINIYMQFLCAKFYLVLSYDKIISYFRTKFLLILEIQYFLLFFLFWLHLPRPSGNITSCRICSTFEIPTRKLYCLVTISDLKLICCKQTTKIEMLRFSLKINISSYSNHFYALKIMNKRELKNIVKGVF